jgi:hypothetical protein
VSLCSRGRILQIPHITFGADLTPPDTVEPCFGTLLALPFPCRFTKKAGKRETTSPEVESIPWSLRRLRYLAVAVHVAAALATIGGFIIHVYMGTVMVRGGFTSIIRGEGGFRHPPIFAAVQYLLQYLSCGFSQAQRCRYSVQGRRHHERPHSALADRTPAAFAELHRHVTEKASTLMERVLQSLLIESLECAEPVSNQVDRTVEAQNL